MRALVAIMLILCGTVLVLAPAQVGILSQFTAAKLLVEREDLTNVTIDSAKMEPAYQYVCWAIGAMMIAIGTIGGMRGGSCSPPPPPKRD